MQSSYADLVKRVTGSVHRRGEPDFASEVAAFNTATIHTPDVVVAVASAADVVEVVRFAREHRQRVTVQATGHGAELPITSGILVSTRRLDHVVVDAAGRTATIGGGARWDAVVAAASEHGLAPIVGSSTNVGVVGYLLGGGVGPLARSHGFSSDYVLGFSVVTGHGELVRASANENADLFWALRGGKLGLGIVTEVQIRLVELRSLYGGSLMFEEEHIEPALRGWVRWTKGADARVTTSVRIIRFPAIEVIPAPLRGRRLLGLHVAFPGPSEDGIRLVRPLRSLAPVYIDDVAEMPAREIARIHADPTKPGPAWATGLNLTHVDDDFATALLRNVGAGTNTPLLGVEVRHLGEATTRDVEEGSSVTGRRAGFVLGIVATNPALFDSAVPLAAETLMRDLAGWSARETNVNFLGAHIAERAETAWPADVRARLEAIRSRHDPHRIFASVDDIS